MLLTRARTENDRRVHSWPLVCRMEPQDDRRKLSSACLYVGWSQAGGEKMRAEAHLALQAPETVGQEDNGKV